MVDEDQPSQEGFPPKLYGIWLTKKLKRKIAKARKRKKEQDRSSKISLRTSQST